MRILGKAENIAIVQEGMYQNTVGDGNVSYLFQSFPDQNRRENWSAESGGENNSHSGTLVMRRTTNQNWP